jgi:pSer/pThr/pTyr-binding forkhead associated (FHA) protein
MRIKITLMDGTVVLDEERKDFPLKLGRHAPCDIVILAPGVSGQHLEIFKNEVGKYFLRDLGSRNGTHLNDERVNLVPVDFPCTFSLGKKVFVELIQQEESSPFLEKYSTNEKQLRVESLLKRKEQVSKMKEKSSFDSTDRKFERSETILAKFQKMQLVHIFWLFFFLVFSYCTVDWIFTRAPLTDLLNESIKVHGQILGFSLGIAAIFSILYFIIRSGILFKALFVSTFFSLSLGKIHYDFLYPFIVSDTFGFHTWALSLALIGFLSILLLSVFLRGLWPSARPGYFSLGITFFTLLVLGFSGEFLWEKKNGGAYADLFRKVEAPNRVLAGVAISPGQFRDEMKRIKLVSQQKK